MEKDNTLSIVQRYKTSKHFLFQPEHFKLSQEIQPLMSLANYGVDVCFPAEVIGNSVAKEFKATQDLDTLTIDA